MVIPPFSAALPAFTRLTSDHHTDDDYGDFGDYGDADYDRIMTIWQKINMIVFSTPEFQNNHIDCWSGGQLMIIMILTRVKISHKNIPVLMNMIRIRNTYYVWSSMIIKYDDDIDTHT